METLGTLIDNTLGPFGGLFILGFIGVVIALISLPTLFRSNKDPLDKLRQLENIQGPGEGGERLSRHTTGNAQVAKFASFLQPEDEEKLSATRQLLIQAGYRDRDAIKTLYAAQFVLAVGLLIVGLFFVIIMGTGMGPLKMVGVGLGPALVGYVLPNYWVQKRVGKRQEEILSGFPDALDLLLVCVEAGQSLDQSIMRVAKEIEASYPALAEEFSMVSHEMKAGKDKSAVLKQMAERCDVPDISSFVTVLIQSAAFGTSIADALRVYAAEMRDKRVMRAEEKANVLPTKLTVGTMMFCVPPLLIILIGPSVYGISQSLSGGGF